MSELPPNPFADQPQANEQAPKPQTQQQYYNQQIPVEVVTLPSKGTVYPIGHPLCNEEAVEIRCMSRKR